MKYPAAAENRSGGFQCKQTVSVLCTGFTVEVGEDWFAVDVKEQEWLRFPVTSALCCADETDTDLGAKELSQSVQGAAQCFVWKTASTLWDTKEWSVIL